MGVLLRRLPALLCRALHILWEKLREMYAVYKSFLVARFRARGIGKSAWLLPLRDCREAKVVSYCF